MNMNMAGESGSKEKWKEKEGIFPSSLKNPKLLYNSHKPLQALLHSECSGEG